MIARAKPKTAELLEADSLEELVHEVSDRIRDGWREPAGQPFRSRNNYEDDLRWYIVMTRDLSGA